jgi:hypothetical protein
VLNCPYYLKISYITSPVREHGMQLDLDILRNDYNSVFWSSIWYFCAKELPFDLFLPYCYPRNNSIEMKREVSFKNLEVNSMNCQIPIRGSQYSELSYQTNNYDINDITLERRESRTKSMDNIKSDNLNL